jgi:hypothetical protein
VDVEGLIMPFSVSSYILGVGTVVGALAVGFGGGALLTNTVMKEHPAGPTRVERVARSEPVPAQQAANVPVASPQENPAPPAQAPSVDRDQAQAVQAPPAQPAAAPAPAPAVQAEPPKPDVQREAERAKDPAPAQPVEQARQPEQAKQAESKEAEQRKTAERKGERQKRYAERKLREITIARMRPRRLEVVEEPEVVVSEPQERHFDLFGTPGFFGRSSYRDE